MTRTYQELVPAQMDRWKLGHGSAACAGTVPLRTLGYRFWEADDTATTAGEQDLKSKL